MNRTANHLFSVLILLLPITGTHAQDDGADLSGHGHAHSGDRAIPVTIWTDAYEVFAEHPFVVKGTPAEFVTHVTDLTTYAPRTKGAVTFVMTQGARRLEQAASAPVRDGIYIQELVFPKTGTWSVVLQIPGDSTINEVPFPPVEVYASQGDADHAPDPEEAEDIQEQGGFSFLKEQQWIIPFRVAPVAVKTVNSTPHYAVPESALAFQDASAYVYVQLGGETFARRQVEVEQRSGGQALIHTGLTEQDHVVTLGVGSLALTHGAPAKPDAIDIVPITEVQIAQFELTCQEVVPGGVEAWIQVPGQIEINLEQMAHVVPRVKGVVSRVDAVLGEQVSAGQVLAVIESRELADAKAGYLSALERQTLAKGQFDREKRLFQQKITSEQDYLASQQVWAEARINHRAARQKLLALGLTKEALDVLPDQAEETITTYSVVAPFDGTIIEKHIVLGEVVDDSSETFIIADLSTVWVDLQVNQQDIGPIESGNPAEVVLDSSTEGVYSMVSYVDPRLDPITRTATVRLELDNSEGNYRSGTFVTGRIGLPSADQGMVIPASAVQIVNDQPGVFVKVEQGFALHYVTLGRKDTEQVEILTGLEGGEQVVTHNAFHLKAELTKQAVSGHGHVH
jgi:membrane fusion protein, heavy metal efflux system